MTNKLNKNNYCLELSNKVISGHTINKQEAIILCSQPLEELCQSANNIRKELCGNFFDLCTIISVKSGKCSEDCKFCGQSGHYNTNCVEYPLMDKDSIVKAIDGCSDRGAMRCSLVASGKALSKQDLQTASDIAKMYKSRKDIKLCGSLGLLAKEQYKMLNKSGLTRIHNNLETSENNFPNVCSTHTYKDKYDAVKDAQSQNMTICSGGLFGMDESFEDRIDLAFALRSLNITSIPINFLVPIKGTPYQDYPIMDIDEARKIVALYRFILPKAFVKLAGGRKNLQDNGRLCFLSGANSMIMGDMLTTAGVEIDADIKMLKELNFDIEKKQ